LFFFFFVFFLFISSYLIFYFLFVFLGFPKKNMQEYCPPLAAASTARDGGPVRPFGRHCGSARDLSARIMSSRGKAGGGLRPIPPARLAAARGPAAGRVGRRRSGVRAVVGGSCLRGVEGLWLGLQAGGQVVIFEPRSGRVQGGFDDCARGAVFKRPPFRWTWTGIAGVWGAVRIGLGGVRVGAGWGFWPGSWGGGGGWAGLVAGVLVA